jgi:hypothetical protein
LLAAAEAERLTGDAINAAFAKVFHRFVTWLPGDPWVRSDEMKERYGIAKDAGEPRDRRLVYSACDRQGCAAAPVFWTVG